MNRNTIVVTFVLVCMLILSGCSAKQSKLSPTDLGHKYFGQGKYKLAFENFKIGAENGNAYARGQLAYLYDNGLGVAKNPTLAAEWYLKGAWSGDSLSLYMIGQSYERKRDYQNAFLNYHQAAKQGLHGAQYKLHLMYKNGHHVEKDLEKSFDWLRQSADGGWNAAEIIAGKCYLGMDCEFNVKADSLAALIYLSASVKKNNPQGMYWLAFMNEHGLGLEVDLEQAKFFYEASANRHGMDAQMRLSEAYIHGQLGYLKDPLIGFSWMKRAAAYGYPNAMHGLAKLYEEGVGVPQSYSEAYSWYSKAAKYNYSDSKKRAAKLKKHL